MSDLTRPQFVRVMAKQLSERIIPKQTTGKYMSMASVILRENLRDLNIRYGDTGYGWKRFDALDMADYEIESGV